MTNVATREGWQFIDQVTELSCGQQGIKSLDGLEQLDHLETFAIANNCEARGWERLYQDRLNVIVAPLNAEHGECNELGDITALRNVQSLKSLIIRDNFSNVFLQAIDYSVLNDLANLRTLVITDSGFYEGIENSKLATFSFASLGNLQQLVFQPRFILDDLPQDYFSPLINLEFLRIDGAIPVLPAPEKLRHFNFSDTRFYANERYPFFENLESISFDRINDKEHMYLKTLSNLHTIVLHNIDVDISETISDMTDLENIHLGSISTFESQHFNLDGHRRLSSFTATDNVPSKNTAVLPASGASLEILDLVFLELTSYDLSRFAQLKQVQLNLEQDPEDIVSLPNAPQLQQLLLSNVRFDSMPVYPDLKQLRIFFTPFIETTRTLDTIEFLRNSPNLEFVVLDINRDADRNYMEPLSELVNLKSLLLFNIESTTPDAFDVMSELTSLEHMELSNVAISDLSPLRNLRNLESLEIWSHSSRSRIEEYAFAQRATPVVDISALSDLTELRKVALNGNSISDLSPLSNLTNLEEIRLVNNDIVSIEPLNSLTKLKDLRLGQNDIVDLTPLSNLTDLTFLDLDQNRIVNLESLSSLDELIELYLGNNQIEDFSALADLSSLRLLDLHNNAITTIHTVLSTFIQSNLKINFRGNNIIDCHSFITEQPGVQFVTLGILVAQCQL